MGRRRDDGVAERGAVHIGAGEGDDERDVFVDGEGLGGGDGGVVHRRDGERDGRDGGIEGSVAGFEGEAVGAGVVGGGGVGVGAES